MSKGKIIHLKKFDNGQSTPQEYHQQYGMRGRKCEGCPAPATVVFRTMVLLSELVQRQPEFVAQIMATSESGGVPTVSTKYGPMVMVSQVGACPNCRRALERSAAKCPSWVLVEIAEGPKQSTLVQVPGAVH